MKKILLVAAALLCLQTYGFSQSNLLKKAPGLQIGLSYNHLLNMPDSMEYNPINSRGFELYNMFGFKNKKETMSFNIGIGISAANFAANINPYDSTIKGDKPFSYIDEDTYKKHKVSIFYLDIPLELAFRGSPDKKRTLNGAIGFKGGVALDAKTKTKREDSDGDNVIIKYKSFDNINRLRYGPTARIGYGPFMVYGFYSLTSIFDPEGSTDLTPLTVGIGFALQ